MTQLVLLRHGESTWNQQNLFTGWTDVPLTANGKDEALRAGRCLRENGFIFDVCYASVLTRAIQTLWIVLEELQQTWIKQNLDWHLNERHYGALQGLNKTQTAQQFGAEQVHAWRRSYDARPPPLTNQDPRSSKQDARYKNLSAAEIPNTESLEDVEHRLLAYWSDNILPVLKSSDKVLIVAHGNSLRALIKHLDHISNEDITDLNIPTGVPLVYEMDEDLNAVGHRYLLE